MCRCQDAYLIGLAWWMTKTRQKELRTATLLLAKANAPERPSESGETMVNAAGKRGVGTMESTCAR